MFSAIVSELSGPGLSPAWGHCVDVFLDKALYFHSSWLVFIILLVKQCALITNCYFLSLGDISRICHKLHLIRSQILSTLSKYCPSLK